MKHAIPTTAVLVGGALLLGATGLRAQDWPQWRGPNRDARASGFKAPSTWPKELTQKWKVTVGEGVATPALVGDKLYLFSRQDGKEILRCLDAATGKEIWQDGYEAGGATGPSSRFSGPRSSPTVADGKVLTVGVQGTFSCLDAGSGKVLWRKDDFKSYRPPFFAASSPLVVDGLCIAQLGGREHGSRDGSLSGGIVAYDLASGAEKWKWGGDGPAYASPEVMNANGVKLIVAETEGKIVAVNAADGKLAWQTPFAARGMGSYNACTPIVDGQTIIYSGAGRGTTAVKVEKEGDQVTAKELWSNKDTAVQFNTPVVKEGFLFGITASNQLFCINMQDGKTAWTAPVGGGRPPAGGGGGGGGRRGRGGMGRGGGYGSVVDAGSVLLALTPSAQLIVFEPSGKEFKKLTGYKVADGDTYAYPVASGNRIYVRDKEAVILWAIE